MPSRGIGQAIPGCSIHCESEPKYINSYELGIKQTYSETDARLLWNEPDDCYTIIALAKNVFDQESYEAASATMSAWGVQTRTRSYTFPRTYGIEAQFRFGN